MHGIAIQIKKLMILFNSIWLKESREIKKHPTKYEKLTESRSTENQIWQIQIGTTQIRTWCQRISYIYCQQQPNSQKAQM